MKTIALIGGTSWTSTLEYYRIINQEIEKNEWTAFCSVHHLLC